MSRPVPAYRSSDTAAMGMSSPYLDAIKSHPLLTAKEECELAGRIAAGDMTARDRLIECNLRLVVMAARKFLGRGTSFDDLIAEGNLGLFRAAEDFDRARGFRFGTYAVYWIEQSIRRALMNTGSTIRIPCHVHTLLNKWRQAERVLCRTRKQRPTSAEVAARLGLDGPKLQIVGHAARARATAGDSGLGDVRCESEPAGAGVDADDEATVLRVYLGRLPAREREALTLRFGLGGAAPLTLPEAGRRMGCSREWVRRLEIAAIDALRAMVPGAGEVSRKVRVVAPRPTVPIASAVPARTCVICGSAFTTDRRRRFTQMTCSKPCLAEQKSISGRRYASLRSAAR